MRHSFFCVAALCLLISLTWVAYAQTGPGAKATEPKNIIPVNSTTAKSEPKEDAEAARIIRERRANAQSLQTSKTKYAHESVAHEISIRGVRLMCLHHQLDAWLTFLDAPAACRPGSID